MPRTLTSWPGLLCGTLALLAAPSALAAAATEQVSAGAASTTYLAGADIGISAPLPADVLALAGHLRAAAPIAGDALFAAGTIILAAPVSGDVRAAAGRLVIEGDVSGEVAALAGALTMTGKAGAVRAAAGSAALRGGADGPVTIYGGSVYLSGEFTGDVYIVASDTVTLGEGTRIQGVLEYNAPQEAGIPASAEIGGGVRYTGSSSFLPTAEEARTLAIAGVGVFFLVRLAAAALAAGLLIGLFPALARSVVREAVGGSTRRFALLALLGAAILAATPLLMLLLTASFVGIGIAALIGSAFLLLILVSYLYAAALAGALLSGLIMKRRSVSWKSAMLGMGALYLAGLIPVLGFLAAFVLLAAAFGALVAVAYRAAFAAPQA